MKKLAIGMLCCLIVVLSGCSTQSGPSSSTPTPAIDESNVNYQLLLMVEQFSIGPVSPPMPDETVWDYSPHAAYMNLYSLSDAKEYFHLLEENGNPQGRLYAMCGLFYLDRQFYDDNIKLYADIEEVVVIADGDVFISMSVGDVVKGESPCPYNFTNGEDMAPLLLHSYLFEWGPQSEG